ncbi:extensin [Iris pallida]|uniref:Extensin n=1 Tax=Iris pallida TaxID=29817 RepID=A0AAX6E8D4_IRIPA|nr:extensin [Iris pallida]
MATREAATPPPVIGKAGRYTVFITPSVTPTPSESPRSSTPSPIPSPSPSPSPSPRNAPSELYRTYSSSPRTRLNPVQSPPLPVQTPPPPPPVQAPPPPVQVPPPQFVKSGGKSTGVFGFFWDAVTKVQDAHATLDGYLADWLGLDQSRYQWALNDYYENNEAGKDCGKPKEHVSKGRAV